MFTVIAVRNMAGSYVQFIVLMRNFGKFQSGMLVLIIWQRHIAICFSLGLRFHCLHTISSTCIFLGKYRSYIWLNILLKNFPHRMKYGTTKKQKTPSPGVEPRSSARASKSLNTALLCHSVFGEVNLFF